ncbi:hypothetical protein GQ54DRAFT_303802 [Martensiomyces pterosporus]|nr:hypothetical protein GQ54DRAFT_303802 [Martensiomyces pterosporus]
MSTSAATPTWLVICLKEVVCIYPCFRFLRMPGTRYPRAVCGASRQMHSVWQARDLLDIHTALAPRQARPMTHSIFACQANPARTDPQISQRVFLKYTHFKSAKKREQQMKIPVALALLALFALVASLRSKEVDAIEQFLKDAESVGQEKGPTNEEIAHSLAVGLGLRNSANLLYKYSPDAKTAYSAIYDTLTYLSVSGFTDQNQKKLISKAAKYFESHLIK